MCSTLLQSQIRNKIYRSDLLSFRTSLTFIPDPGLKISAFCKGIDGILKQNRLEYGNYRYISC
jgi:hypothetical protein